MAGDMRVPVIVRTQIASGVSFPDANLIIFGANDLSDDADIPRAPSRRNRRPPPSSPTSAISPIGDYVVHVEHGIAQYQGLKEIVQDGLAVEFMILEFAEQAKLYVPLTRLDLIQKYRSTDTGPAPVLNKLGSQQWVKTKARVKKAMQDMAAELLKLYAQRHTAAGHGLFAGQRFSARVRRRLRLQRDRRSAHRHRRHQARHGIDHADGPSALRRRGLRQDRSRHARRLQGRAGRQAGRGPHADHGPRLPALRDLQAAASRNSPSPSR